MAKKETTETQTESRFAGAVLLETSDIPASNVVRPPKPEVLEMRALIDQSVEANQPIGIDCPELEVDALRALIHRAARSGGGEPVEIGTRFDAANGRITFGPKALFRKVRG